MKLHPCLLLWMLRPLWPLNLAFSLAAVLWAFFESDPLFETRLAPGIFIPLHSLLAVSALHWGGERAGAFAFLHTRGHSPVELWRHRFLAGACSAMIVLAPTLLVVLSSLRSLVQGDLLENPYYPIMIARERPVALVWLALYALMMPAAHYAWVRRGQPARDPMAGHWLLYSLPVALFCAGAMPSPHELYAWPRVMAMTGVCLALAGLFVWACRRLSPSMEIPSN